jgi:hypothetical protein
VHVVEMDDEELYVPDDVLKEASSASYQMLPKNQNYRQWAKVKWTKGKPSPTGNYGYRFAV